MAKTLSKVIEELSQLKHRRTIYEQMVGFLSQYVPDELSADDVPQELETSGVGPVPRDLLQDTIDDLEENGIAYLDKQIKKIEKTEIPEDEQEQEEEPEAITNEEGEGEDGGEGGNGAGEANASGGDPSPDKRIQLRRRRKAKDTRARAG